MKFKIYSVESNGKRYSFRTYTGLTYALHSFPGLFDSSTIKTQKATFKEWVLNKPKKIAKRKKSK
jgi:hypothetical protein